MSNLKTTKATEQLTKNLQLCSKKNSENVVIKKEGYSEVSIYSGECTPLETAKSIKRLKDSFPQLPTEFHDVLTDRIMELNISDQRFKDAVNYVIDNCIYPTPTIAQFISFDKKIKLFSYDEYLKINNDLQNTAGKYYKPIRIPNQEKPLWARIRDINEFNLELWNKEK